MLPVLSTLLGLAALALATKTYAAPAAAAPAEDLQQQQALLGLVNEPATGDLDSMRRKGVIRVLTTYNRTNFFIIGGRHHGFEYELLKQYEQFLNSTASDNGLETQLVFIPMPFQRLLPALLEGKGDVVAAGLTITPERAEQVAFTEPYIPDVREIVVSHTGVTDLQTEKDLAGRAVYVLRGSSYVQHLRALNQRFAAQGLAPIKITEMHEYLQTEDLLEMVNAGALPLMAADEHIARLWTAVLPDIRLQRDLVINHGGQIAWAVRPTNPKLRESLNAFIDDNRKGTLIGNILFGRYYQNTKWIENPVDAEDRRRLKEIADLIRKYADRYGFDWLAIAAQAYQESGLDQSAVSPAGAIGIMQVLKSTASAPPVEIAAIEELENNIHAGVKYLHHIRKHYFAEPAIAAEDRVYFSFAAYNAGPTKINRIRRRAAAMGLDSNRWFGQTELAARKLIGQETVRYVRNILKYYTVFKLAFPARQHLEGAL